MLMMRFSKGFPFQTLPPPSAWALACAHWMLTTILGSGLTLLLLLMDARLSAFDWRTELAFAAFIGFVLGGLGLWLPAAFFRGALAVLPGRPLAAHLGVGLGLALAYAGLSLGLLAMHRAKAVEAEFYHFLQTALLPWACASLFAGLWLLPHRSIDE
jgi:hypothetical protein